MLILVTGCDSYNNVFNTPIIFYICFPLICKNICKSLEPFPQAILHNHLFIIFPKPKKQQFPQSEVLMHSDVTIYCLLRYYKQHPNLSTSAVCTEIPLCSIIFYLSQVSPKFVQVSHEYVIVHICSCTGSSFFIEIFI